MKFGHGDAVRVRAHLREGAKVVQVIEATHGEVVRAELVLKRRYPGVAREKGQPMPATFGAGTEVLPESMVFDLSGALHGDDVSFRFT